ncbi:uncharacterized protein C11orf16 homolog [Hippopotamus amphibius kiboko]|uniref:uncharacterized protein C11orf16 homolog n=1 Tax=Hippopotamus amphibius kiboko TaxID=575201 RepID=UPI00259919A5|nr:uncharacterized protein C11orf16 homolog [Hippopotamus amphibius kiboko]
MDSSAGPGMPLPRYCSVATTLKAPAWVGTAPPWDFSFACPLASRAPWLARHSPLTRYASYHPCLHIADPAWQGPGWLGRNGDAVDTWVLARREPDGFYYRAQIKAAPELERRGFLLVEFEAPLVTGPELPTQRQSVVLEEDVIRFSPSMEYSLRPGDKVLALWGPDQQRYGPGTVLLGLEARDPQRAAKKEEITVHFWNGMTAPVPLGGVRWVPPAIWKKAVGGLYKAFTTDHPRPLLWAPYCSLVGPFAGCVTSGLPLSTPLLCPSCHPHACCQLLGQGCLCCCPLAGPTWWPLIRMSGVPAREHPEVELKPTAQLLPLEHPKEEVAVQAPVAGSSSSTASASEEEDLQNELEMGLPQRLLVDSTVNTDPILLEKSPRRQGGLCQPEWRYWRRNRSEPHPGTPGTRICNIRKDEKGNKNQRVKTAAVGSRRELVLEATGMKPLQILPEEDENKKLSRGAAAHQGDQDSP